MPRNRSTLRSQLVVMLACLACVPVLLFGWAEARAWSESEGDRADRETLLASTSLARELGRLMDTHARVVRAVAAELGELGSGADEDAVESVLHRYVAQFPGFYGMTVLDDQGTAIAGSINPMHEGRSNIGISYRDRGYIDRLLHGAEFAASEVLISRTTNRPAVILAAPILSRTGTLIGMISGGVDLAMVEQVIARVTAAAPDLAGIIVDENGTMVALAGTPQLSSMQKLPQSSLFLPSTTASPERRRGTDAAGRYQRGTVVMLESSAVRWSVLTMLPSAVVERRVERLLATMGMFAVAALVVGLVAAFVLSRIIARPVTHVATLIDALGRGDLRSRPSQPAWWHSREVANLSASVDRTTGHLLELIGELERTAVAVSELTHELLRASARMVKDSQSQGNAVLNGSGAIVEMTDSIGGVRAGTHELTETATQTTQSILGVDRQIERIAGHMGTLNRAIERASHDIELLGREVDQVHDGTAQLGHSVAHTTESLKVLTVSIGAVADRAEQSQALAKDAIVAADEGRAAVEETIVATEEIRRSFEAVERVVESLAGRSQTISQVSRVIDEVTRATHLLAINASVIASQAGEHGKGFAVVADGVRQVAKETAASTQEIVKLVASVQADIQEAVEAVRQGQTTVKGGEQRSAEAGRRLAVISDRSTQAGLVVRQIADAAREQSQRVRMVEAAFHEVGNATLQIHASATEQRDAQQGLVATMSEVRAVGEEVHRSTQEQRTSSGKMTGAVRAMTERLRAIADAVQKQHAQRDNIQGSLRIFNDASASNVERARRIDEAVATLGQRLARLQNQVRSFRVE